MVVVVVVGCGVGGGGGGDGGLLLVVDCNGLWCAMVVASFFFVMGCGMMARGDREGRRT